MKTPESRSGLRIARFWKTKASISMPAPAIVHAISEPRIPVATPKRAGSEKTPAPTIPPTTMAARVGTLIFAPAGGAGASVSVLMPSHSCLLLGVDRVDLLDAESGEAVHDAQCRAGVAEDCVRQVEEGRDAQGGAHERATGVPGHEGRRHRAAVGGQPGQVGRRQPALGELGAEDPAGQHQGDVLVAGDQVEAE